MYEILLGLFLIVAILLVAVILLQQGKGADMGASFGAGGANTVFGSAGAGNFLTRSTWTLAGIGLVLVVALAYLSSHRSEAEQKADIFTETTAPAATETTPAPVVGDVPAAPVATEAASDVPLSSENKPASDVPN
jgi:preprotein translocase subunit SecG